MPATSAAPRRVSLQEAHLMACLNAGALLVYLAAQATLSLLFGRENAPLKLVLEPYLLMLGLVLHIQWRTISRTFREHEQPRPTWIAAGDCLSFVVTFWAVFTLTHAFIQQLTK